MRAKNEMDDILLCELNDCVKNVQKIVKVILGDMTAKVSNKEIE